jgi:hypothetical protein
VLLKWHPQKILRSFYDDDAALCELVSQAVFRRPDWLEMGSGHAR